MKRSLLFLMAFCLPLKASEIIELPGYAFKYSVETSADKSAVWQLWEDVDNWKQFDERLKYSYLNEEFEFQAGAIGYIKGKGAPKTKFELLNVKHGESFDQKLLLPLWQSVLLKRYFEEASEGNIVFTHEVHFQGSLSGLYSLFLSGAFRKDIVLVMAKMKSLVEPSTEGEDKGNEIEE